MKTAKSLDALGRALGKSKQAVHKWVRDPRWNQRRSGPWDVAKAREWAKIHLREDHNDEQARRRPAAISGAAAKAILGKDPRDIDEMERLRKSPERQVKYRLLLARAVGVEIDNQIATGELIKRADVEAAAIAKVYLVKTSLMYLGRELAPVLMGVHDEQEIRKVIDARIWQILQEFAAGTAAAVEIANQEPGARVSAGG